MRKILAFSGLLLLLALLPYSAAHASTQAASDCKLTVPPNPLTSAGLATPWILSNGAASCHEGDPNSAVFVQATIFSPSEGLMVYSPLVVDAGTTPSIAPTAPNLPSDAVVGIFVGGDDNSTKLVGNTADVAQCVNGEPHPFGQVAYCNTPALFSAMTLAGVTPPPLGTAIDGLPCPTVRDFSIVDQDQSDNVQTTYLFKSDGTTAQDTASNRAALGTFSVIKNPSDNRVLTNFMDKALGCSPWTAPDLANGGVPAFSQALDEYQANALQGSPQALVPLGDPMVMANGRENATKDALYRVGMDQPVGGDMSTKTYCSNILAFAPSRLKLNESILVNYPPSVASIGNNLFTFMAARLDFTLRQPAGTGLGCVALGFTDPVHLTLDANGVAVGATID